MKKRDKSKWGEPTKVDRTGSDVDDKVFRVRITVVPIPIIVANGILEGSVVEARWHPEAGMVPCRGGGLSEPSRDRNRTIVVAGQMGDDCVFFHNEYEVVE